MIIRARIAQLLVDHGMESGGNIFRQVFDDMHGQVILFLGIGNPNRSTVAFEDALITYLSAGVPIKRGLIEYQLVIGLILGLHPAVARNTDIGFQGVVTYEFTLGDREQFHPIVGIYGSRIARAFLLFLQLLTESVSVDFHAVLMRNQLDQVDRETVGIVQQERVAAADRILSGLLGFRDHTVHQVDPGSQRAQECALLFGNHFGDQILLRPQFGKLVAHLLHQTFDQLTDKRLVETEVGVTISYSAT